jgi:hypothetical protein
MNFLQKRGVVVGGALVWLGAASWACSGGGDTQDGGADSGGSDATSDVQQQKDGAADVVTSSDGGATLTGEQAFPITFTWMDPAMPTSECGGNNATPDGGIAATAVILAANDLTALACGDGGAPAQGKLVEIGIATPAWVLNQQTTQTQSLAPGSYPVGDQKVPDEDFCMIPQGKTAWFQVLQFNDAGTPFATWNGVSGSIDVTNVTNSAVAGSFNVKLGDANGGSADGGTLSGTFSASTCGH